MPHISQVRKFVRHQKQRIAATHIDEISLLPALILDLQRNDPGGIYILGHEPLSYDVGKRKDIEDRMYKRMFILPSCNINFWNFSRKGGSIDGAHLTSFFEGTLLSLTVKNANNVIHTVCLGFVSSNEDAEAWNWFCSLMFQHLPGVEYIISDRASGLNAIRQQITKDENANARHCTWILCSLHALGNEGITSAEGKAAVTIWAKSTNQERYNESFENLKSAIGNDRAMRMKERDLSDHITFYTARLNGLKTSYGEINTNGAEQGNNLLAEIREMPLASSVCTYLKNTSLRFAENVLCCNNDINNSLFVVSKIMTAMIDKVKKFRYMWTVEIRQLDEYLVEAIVHKNTKELYVIFFNAKVEHMPWYERIQCSCEETLLHGYPCFHSSFALVDMQTTRFDVSIWGIHLAKWYSPVFHLSNYKLQYSSIVYVPDTHNLLRSRLFPNQIKGRTGRPSKARKKNMKSKKKVVQKASTCIKENEPYLVKNVNTKLPNFVIDTLAKKPRQYRCSACTGSGHNTLSCGHKFTEYFVLKDGMFLFDLKSIASLQSEDATDNDISFVTCVEEPSTNVDIDNRRLSMKTTIYEPEAHNAKVAQLPGILGENECETKTEKNAYIDVKPGEIVDMTSDDIVTQLKEKADIYNYFLHMSSFDRKFT